ncbi:MAG: formate dehydrogenase accessory sulfurtransferase FdhD [Peptostreptococcales bacterium]
MKCVRPVKILKVRDKMQHEMEDYVVVEYELSLSINGSEFIRFICTPEKMEELAIGHLYSENIIKDYDSITGIQFETLDEESGKMNLDITHPDSFVDNYHVLNAHPELDLERISQIMRVFNKRSRLFMDTGGVHSCGITDLNTEDILYFAEDIGRHNALDKVVGWMLKEKADFKDKILLTSGRVSSEIVYKALSAKIGVLVSRSAPTSKALSIAAKYNMTIVGFARGNRLNVYIGSSPSN